MTKLHDLIVYGPTFPEGVRFNGCDDVEIKWWTNYALEKGATRFETMPSEETLDPIESASWELDKAASEFSKAMDQHAY